MLLLKNILKFEHKEKSDQGMNFHIKIITFLSFLAVASICSYAQTNRQYEFGMPYIQNYELKAFGYQNQTYSTVQDNNGVLFFGNANGILRFDGYNWNLIPIKGIPRLSILNNKIFAGGYNTFGYVDIDESGNLYFKNLLQNNDLGEIGQIQEITSCENAVYFTASNTLIKYNDTTGFVILDKSEHDISLHKTTCKELDNCVITHTFEKGIRVINQGKLQHPDSKVHFSNQTIENIFSFRDRLFIDNGHDKHIYYYTQNEFHELESKSYIGLKEYNTTNFIELNEFFSVTGTDKNGIFLIDSTDTVIAHFEETNGLANNHIHHLFIDQSNNLWIAHNTGVSRIEFPAAFTYFNKANGLEGTVNSILRYNKDLYVATENGVFILDHGQGNKGIPARFKLIKESSNGGVDLYTMDNNLYYTNHRGIYQIKNKKAILFYDAGYNAFNVLEVSKFNKNLIYLGTDSGLLVLKYIGNKWIKIGVLQNFNYQIKNIVEGHDGSVWVVTEYNGCFRIPPNDFFDINSSIDQFEANRGLPTDLQWITPVKTSESVLFMTSKGVFRYDSKKEGFIEDKQFGKEFLSSDRWVYPIVEDNQKNYWFSEVITDQNFSRSAYVAKHLSSKNREVSKLPIDKIKEFDIEYIYPDQNNIIWFGGNKGLIRFDFDQINQKNIFSALVNGITTINDSITNYYSLYGLNYSKLDITERNLRFDCAATDYISHNKTQYQYRLKRLNPGWSNWENSNIKEYTNLKSGEYTFEVRAKDINGNISEISKINFNIERPFYASAIAIILYSIGLILFLIVIYYWLKYINANERFKLESIINLRTNDLVQEKEKAENLISRVLEKKTVNDFKKDHEGETRRIKMATVLFSDIHGFRKISDKVNSEILIDELDNFALKFDKVVKRFGIEKVKTIGDMYMCVGGIPDPNRTNPIEVIMAALELQNFMNEIQHRRESAEQIWDLRIGIDTGPVIIGVSGRRKKSFDVWGATVNTANRLESAGEPGKINISGNTYLLVKDYFSCKYYGKVPVKNKGDIDMFYVEGFKPKLSENMNGIVPSKEFLAQLQLLRLGDLEEFVLARLEDGLPNTLYYHNLKHTVDVYTQVELIGRSENLGKEELLILRTAALFHDAGHLIDYFTHEEQGVKLAKEILPQYFYSNEQIASICELILATKMPPKPKNIMESIICDADLDYLGRSDFIPVSNNLYRELRERGHLGTLAEWNIMQMKFLEKHAYFTETARKLRDNNKAKQLQLIRKIVEDEANLTE